MAINIIKNKKHFIKICPKCGNIDLPIRSNFAEILAPTPEKCKKCGYSGLFPEIYINEIEEFRKEIKRSKIN